MNIPVSKPLASLEHWYDLCLPTFGALSYI
jgi:hypothetical protein